jgi:hypothetical protein
LRFSKRGVGWLVGWAWWATFRHVCQENFFRVPRGNCPDFLSAHDSPSNLAWSRTLAESRYREGTSRALTAGFPQQDEVWITTDQLVRFYTNELDEIF